MVIGSIAATCHGAALPLMIIVFGDMTDMFIFNEIFSKYLDEYWDIIDPFYNYTYTKDDFMDNPEDIM